MSIPIHITPNNEYHMIQRVAQVYIEFGWYKRLFHRHSFSATQWRKWLWWFCRCWIGKEFRQTRWWDDFRSRSPCRWCWRCCKGGWDLARSSNQNLKYWQVYFKIYSNVFNIHVPYKKLKTIPEYVHSRLIAHTVVSTYIGTYCNGTYTVDIVKFTQNQIRMTIYVVNSFR